MNYEEVKSKIEDACSTLGVLPKVSISKDKEEESTVELCDFKITGRPRSWSVFTSIYKNYTEIPKVEFGVVLSEVLNLLNAYYNGE